MTIKAGDWVIVTDAHGQEHRVEALSGPERGRDFPVVWVRTPLKGGGFDRVPWPLEAVRPTGDESG